MKRCFKCGATKPLDEFYRHPKTADGHLGKCKDCSRTYAAAHQAARDPEEKRRYTREYMRAYRLDPTKKRARNALTTALRNGTLVRGPCENGVECSGQIEGHHDDYSRPLDVRWLCLKHHHMLHRNQ